MKKEKEKPNEPKAPKLEDILLNLDKRINDQGEELKKTQSQFGEIVKAQQEALLAIQAQAAPVVDERSQSELNKPITKGDILPLIKEFMGFYRSQQGGGQDPKIAMALEMQEKMFSIFYEKVMKSIVGTSSGSEAGVA